ncbi:MAG: sigma-70 family RNA polymerase sigma factor [Polyangiaceae bacterium]|nr:sigma-70 family RNA polymerase sigma factor [Polyangiaceae bacterium]
MIATDAELISQWRNGDRRAGAALFERHYPAIARFFHNKVDDGVRDELVQNVFLACLENPAGFRGEASFKTYLFGIAHHILNDFLRARIRKSRREDVAFDVQSVIDLGQSPEQPMVEHQEQRALLEALRRIPLDYQVVLELHYWERLTAAEIGLAIGIPLGTAKTRLLEGRKALESALTKIDVSREILQSTLDDLDGWALRVRPQIPLIQRDRGSG